MLLLQRKVGSVNFDEKIEPWCLGLADYKGGGGLAALLSAHADEITAKATPDPRRRTIVRKLFRALMDIDQGRVVRRPRAFADLVKLTESDQRTLKDVIDHFRMEGVAFLRPYGDAQIGPTTPISISHDALINCWQRLAAMKKLLEEPIKYNSTPTKPTSTVTGHGGTKPNSPKSNFDVFLAYAHEDKERARRLADSLREKGYEVFWDPRIPTGESWRSYIFQVLMASKCVVVAWSHNSIRSEWVLQEAEVGKRERKLIPVLLDDIEVPFGFLFIQAADLSEWRPDCLSESFEDFLGGVAGLVRPGET
jgi:hypothetical protein